MVGHLDLDDREKELVESLFLGVSESERCPFIRRDEEGHYCSSGLDGREVNETRRVCCDVYSLQLWCLDKSRCENCIFYDSGGKIFDSNFRI